MTALVGSDTASGYDQHFAARPYQIDVLHAFATGQTKRAMLVWHRGAGKDKTCWTLMGERAARKVGNYFYFFPTYNQARVALWDNIDNDGFRTINHVPPVYVARQNEVEMQLELVNGSTIKLLGLDQPKQVDRVRGVNPAGAVFSEYAFMGPYGWEVMQPRLEQNGGWAIFNTTPNGPNHAQDMWDMAVTSKDWFAQLLTVEDTGAPVDIERLRAEGVPEERIEQEYFCSFAGIRTGSYFGALLQGAEEEGRIGIVPHDPSQVVDTAWDIGYGDATAIWFLQDGGERIIDYYEGSGVGVEYYAHVLQQMGAERGYVYGKHWAPHDIEHGDWSTGASRVETARELGLHFETAPKLGLDEGIEATGRLIRRAQFDQGRCQQGLSALRSYRREWDDQRKTYRNRPDHDWASHGADALRTYAVCDRRNLEQVDLVPPIVTGRHRRGFTQGNTWLRR